MKPIAPSQRSGVTGPTPRTTERGRAEAADGKYADDDRQVADDHSPQPGRPPPATVEQAPPQPSRPPPA